MCTKNYILLNRNLLINDLWNSEPFTRGQAWVDLLLNTNWKDGTAIIKGVSIPVKRGQACRSVKQLAIRWKWSEGKVKRYLDLLVSLGQISYETCGKNGAVNGAVKTGITTLIAILNYNTYQLDGAENGAQTERRRSGDGAQTETYKKEKKDEEGIEGKEKKLLPICAAWHGFKEMRVKIKRPLTAKGMNLAAQKLASLQSSGNDPVEVLNQSTFNSWQGLFPTKEQHNGRQGTTGSAAHPRAEKGKPQGPTIDSTPKPAGHFAGDFPDRSDEW